MSIEIITPDWPASPNIKVASTTRAGGVSVSPYDSFNLADHVGDDPAAVETNRQLLVNTLSLPSSPVWLKQVHGNAVIDVGSHPDNETVYEADASYTTRAGVVCAVMTADCLPVLMCDRQGSQVAAVHAGWRGLTAGVIEATVRSLTCAAADLLVWLGPAIGQQHFAVGDEVRELFVAHDSTAEVAFTSRGDAKWLADIHQLAWQRLVSIGVENIFGGGECSYENTGKFYSYRRDGPTGRMASLIWMD
ncbi:MAG: purine nucleoside phosphorylase YfiH [Gammaproteobacteria bacterium]|nr:MAG: purine nucleoside phosphorylase YfiH [Gammaproteobacteria bacterium]